MVLDAARMPLPLNSLEVPKLTLGRVTLSVTTGNGYPGSSNSYQAEGRLTATNYRLVFTSEPPPPLFDSFMVTWNKISDIKIRNPSSWFGKVVGGSPTVSARVMPLDDEDYLRGAATLAINLGNGDEAQQLYDVMSGSRWTGHLDPDNTLEPPPPQYFSNPPESSQNLTLTLQSNSIQDVPASPPPNYDEAIKRFQM